MLDKVFKAIDKVDQISSKVDRVDRTFDRVEGQAGKLSQKPSKMKWVIIGIVIILVIFYIIFS